MLSFKEYIKENNSKIITLYHGQKGYRGKKFDEFDFNIFTYFYLTPERSYCLNYAISEEAIHTFKVDTSNFVDLSSLKANFDYKTFVRLFHQKTGVYYPSEFKFYGSYLWELIRFDSKGFIAKRLLSNGINGFKMTEWYGFKDDYKKNNHEVYVLLNNDPIVKEIKEEYSNKIIGYHVSPSKLDSKILKEGIKKIPKVIYNRLGKKEMSTIRNYFWLELEYAEWFKKFNEEDGYKPQDMTIWEVDLTGYDLIKDEEASDMSIWSSRFSKGDGRAIYVERNIPPDRIIDEV